ncbi:S1 RNA-binding domain-containing protein [Nonomuraea roseola]|uniref:S1 RNA-binding domain-containing protein n=1 Tax=Nonomuraea roseola TaxID=46179 RepID=A0ABV5QBQ0_9ACTN
MGSVRRSYREPADRRCATAIGQRRRHKLPGTVRPSELTSVPVKASPAVVQVDDEVTVVVTAIDRERRRLSLFRRKATPNRR